MSVNHDGLEKFKKNVRKKQGQFLIAAGHIGVNQVIQNSHVLTGLSRNAVIFRTFGGKTSPFGTLPGLEGQVEKPRRSIGKPQSADFIRVGGNVIYMPVNEKRFGIFAGSMDDIIPQLHKLARKVF
jgi:hypothetical protein